MNFCPTEFRIPPAPMPPDDHRARRLGGEPAFIGEGASAVRPASTAISPASLLTRHVVRDGETILLILKPSRWFVGLTCVRFAAAVSIILCALHMSRMPQVNMRYYLDAGAFAVACRVMWATLHWMGRLYVLTDQRILRCSGVFHIDIFECPLRKVARTNLLRPFSERLLRLGTIEIHPMDETQSPSAWQMISRPREVREQIEAAIRKAKQGGCGGTGDR